jgi:hypothetical protein
LKLRSDALAQAKLAKLRSMYEPYMHGASRNLMFMLPAWRHPERQRDNWQAGPWDRLIQAQGLAILGQKTQYPGPGLDGDHF